MDKSSEIPPLPLPALTSVQNEVNLSLVEQGLLVKKHLNVGNKGDMVWGCPLLGFYSKVRNRSYKGNFKGKADKLLNRNTFSSFHVFSGYWWPYCFGPSDDIET